MELEIVPMTAAHVPAVAALELLSFPMPWSAQDIAGELENPLSLWLVALFEEKLIGYIGSQTVLDAADIMNVAVSPEWRRHGVGRALLLALEERLRAAGVTSMTLEVRPSNLPAQTLYRVLGYCQVGRRKNYYINPKEDALILRKEWHV